MNTKKYWKTPFYHLIDIALVNAYVIYNWIRMECGLSRITQNNFRDAYILLTMMKHDHSSLPYTATTSLNTSSIEALNSSSIQPSPSINTSSIELSPPTH